MNRLAAARNRPSTQPVGGSRSADLGHGRPPSTARMGSTAAPPNHHSLAPGTVASRAALFEQQASCPPHARNRGSAGTAGQDPPPAPTAEATTRRQAAADAADSAGSTDNEPPLVNVAPVLLLRDTPSHDIELSSCSDSEPEAAASAAVAAAPPAAPAAAAEPSTPGRQLGAPSPSSTSSEAAAAGAGSNSLARSNSSGCSIIRTRCRITGHYIDTPAPVRHSFVPLPGATPAAACAAGAAAGTAGPTASRPDLPPPAAVPGLQLEADLIPAADGGAPAAAAGRAAAGSSSAGSGLRQRRKTGQPAPRVRSALRHKSPRPAADPALPAHAAVAAAAVNAVAAALARAPAAAATAAASAAAAAAAAAEKAAAVALAAATVTAAPGQQAAAPAAAAAAPGQQAAAAAATGRSESATQTPSHAATQTAPLAMAAAGQPAALSAVAPSPVAAAAPAANPAAVPDPAAAAEKRPRHSSNSGRSSSGSGGHSQSSGGSVISSIWSSNWSRKWSSSSGGSGSSGGSSRASSSARRSSSSSASSNASSAAARAAFSWAALTSLLAIIGVLGTVGTALVASHLAGRHAAAGLARQAMAAAAAGGSSSSGSRVWGATQSLLGASFRAAQHPAGNLAAAGPAHMTAAAAAAVSHPGSSWSPFKSQLWGGSVITSLGRLNAARNRHTAAAGGGGGSSSPDGQQQPANSQLPPIVMYAVIDDAVTSPFKGADWGAVISHMSQRLAWSNPAFVLEVLTQQQLREDEAARLRLAEGLSSSSSSHQIFVGIAISDADVADFVTRVTSNVKTALFFDSAASLQQQRRVDGFAPATAGPLAQLLAERVGFSREAKAAGVIKTIDSLWSRHTSDDLLFIWLVLLNQYVTAVPAVAESTKGTDLPSLMCMVRHCGRQIVDCVTDATCKAGLDCLEGCAFNDQVCQYRCIVSYETPKFGQFALCILQLHNCRNLDAQMPKLPDPAPMASWRGAPLTHEAAEQLFIGWRELGPQLPAGAGPEQLRPYSWLVAAGKNPAYDFFPCQHQLYYAGKGKGQFWYEPVFKAITLEGKEVWRRRKYRVRRGFAPGTFHYTVLDNGVTSNEFWRIIDCDEGLSWCLFYYSGAAATAGLSSSGAVLATVDGAWPAADTARVHEALGRAGIQPWELSNVDNSACVGAPL